MGDAQRLLRIDKEAPLKDQKIALLEQPGPAFLNFRLQIKHSAIRIPHSAIVIRERPRSENRNLIGSYKDCSDGPLLFLGFW